MPRSPKTPPQDTKVRTLFDAALAEVSKVGLTAGGRFETIEPLFLKTMTAFDQLVADGTATQGDIQNGKGDFFNDVLQVLLEQCSGKHLGTRPKVRGLSFPNHMLDIAYPATGRVTFTIETKATGAPKHPRNTRQKNVDGRPGSSDLEKRVKEAAFKNIDLKAEDARHGGRGGGATSDLMSFLRAALPRCYMFLSVRVVSDKDLQRTIHFANIANQWFDGCGLYSYGWNEKRTAYERKAVGSHLELDRVLAQVCTALRHLP
jgi:hypothetical protein